MQLTLNYTKSVQENAARYFERAKKLKKKYEGTQHALVQLQNKLEHLRQQQERSLHEAAQQSSKIPRKKEWFEKFRWFYSSEGFLVIGGRDATTNEILIKKHTEKHDIVFHTDMAGSPFFVIKTEGKTVDSLTLQEAANATAIYSRAWKLGLATLEVFYVTPEQVSKETKPGEYMPKGAFMIYGKTTYLVPKMECAVGIIEGKIIGGPLTAVKKHTAKYFQIIQGYEKPSDIAKELRKKLGGGELDDIIRMLPSGGCKVKK